MPAFLAKRLDVSSPFQIKVLNDQLVLHCYQERGGGRTPREVHRNYVLPSDVDLKTLKSTFRADGTLQIIASKRR